MKEKRLTKKIVIALAIVLITIISLMFVFIKLNKHNDSISNNTQDVNDIQEVDNAIVKEETSEETKEEYYNVTFYDEDGKVLFNKVYKYGDMPSCDEKIKNKTIDGITYTFKSWSPLFHKVEENQTYVATYKAISLNNNVALEPVIISSSTTRTPDPTDATITYRDALGNTKKLDLPKNTTISFSAGEHGLYNNIPSPITLSSKQELDITTVNYDPDKVEVNYIFKGFSYSGNTFTAMYEKTSNIINYEIKRSDNVIIKNDVAYIELEYIESTGTQYINTGLIYQENDIVKTTIEMANSNLSQNDKTLFGSFKSSKRSGYIYYNASGNQYRFALGSGDGLAFSYNSSDKFKIEVERNGNTISCKFNDGTPTTYTNTVSHYTGITEYLFAGNLEGVAQWQSSIKLSNYKVEINNELVRDLIPAEKLDGTVGMLDLVSGTFFANSGTGTFYSNQVIISTDLSAGKIYAYETGSSIELIATPNEGYEFACWSDGLTNATRTVSTGDNNTYTAIFKIEDSYE